MNKEIKMTKFTFKRTWYEAIKNYNPQIRLDIYERIIEYGLDDETTEDVCEAGKPIFSIIQEEMKRNKIQNKYVKNTYLKRKEKYKEYSITDKNNN